MTQLDDQFLADVGLAELPARERVSFLQHVYDELSLSVGTRFSDGLSDAPVGRVRSNHRSERSLGHALAGRDVPDFLDDPLYARVASQIGEGSDHDVVFGYAAVKWLELNRPNNVDLVAAVIDELKVEISAQASRILSAARRAAVGVPLSHFSPCPARSGRLDAASGQGRRDNRLADPQNPLLPRGVR